jgi:glycosyltransferase involved in cell wall biosynthesis
VTDDRVPILCIAPAVDLSGSELETIDWFKQIDRGRWKPSLITTQPSANRRLHEVEPFAEEVWELPDLMAGAGFPEFILGFIESRGVRLVQITDSRLGFDLLPDMTSLPDPLAVVVRMRAPKPPQADYVPYVARRYGNLVDAFSVTDVQVKDTVVGQGIPPSRIEVIDSRMGAESVGRGHGELYERLLTARSAASRWRIEEPGAAPRGTAPSPPPLRLSRNPLPEPTVSVGVPCYGHGIYLDGCIRSIKMQFLKPAKIAIVDDGSEDPETIEALERWEPDPAVTVLRQPANLGPSAARNRALEIFDTSYGLWIDADDQLLPGALDSMMAKLEAAPEDVGFVYPHAMHMGNRSDYVAMPAYNLWLLLQNNICPSPALFDLRVFDDTGVSYPEDMVVGHEDWDIILQLAERGVRGLHADSPTFLYRKQGFSRVHAVDYGPHDFHQTIEDRHPGLYADRTSIKASWAPALSIVLLDGADAAWHKADLGGLSRQSCQDFELVASADLGHGARVVTSDATSGDAWAQAAIREARGRWVCLLAPAAGGILANRAFVEQLLRSFEAQGGLAAVALSSATGIARHAFARLNAVERRSAEPDGLAFERPPDNSVPSIELSEEGSVLADLVIGLQDQGIVQWRLAPATDRQANGSAADAARSGAPFHLDLDYGRATDPSETAVSHLISVQEPLLPELTAGTVRRWEDLPSWLPPDTQPLCRHRQVDGPAHMVTNDRNPPPGFQLDFDLGVTHVHAVPGALRLVYRAGTYELSDDQDELPEGQPLGYIEQQRLPMCERLELREMPSGGRVLVAGFDDPLSEVAKPLATLGWLDSFPIQPRGDLFGPEPWRTITLHREVDVGTGRHTYTAEPMDHRSGAIALGSLLSSPGRDLVALRLRADGRLATDLARPGRATRDPRRLVRWIASPPASDDGDRYWPPPARAKFLLRHWTRRRLSDEQGATIGWLRREGVPGCQPLFSTTHPVTGDQLVTCTPGEAIEIGYLPDGVLGFILKGDVENNADATPYTVPWADFAG